jgi:hypothetical protein
MQRGKPREQKRRKFLKNHEENLSFLRGRESEAEIIGH